MTRRHARHFVTRAARLLLVIAAACAGCDSSDTPMGMHGRLKPFEGSPVFDDRSSARPPVEGTIARGRLDEDDAFFRGREGAALVPRVPFTLTMDDLRRGQERFMIFCSPCHGADGYGGGMIVRRGYSPPPSYHQERLRTLPDGHIFEVITRGYGRMPAMAYQVPPRDRWLITAYVRSLQRSQFVPAEELSPELLPAVGPETVGSAAPEGATR